MPDEPRVDERRELRNARRDRIHALRLQLDAALAEVEDHINVHIRRRERAEEHVERREDDERLREEFLAALRDVRHSLEESRRRLDREFVF